MPETTQTSNKYGFFIHAQLLRPLGMTWGTGGLVPFRATFGKSVGTAGLRHEVHEEMVFTMVFGGAWSTHGEKPGGAWQKKQPAWRKTEGAWRNARAISLSFFNREIMSCDPAFLSCGPAFLSCAPGFSPCVRHAPCHAGSAGTVAHVWVAAEQCVWGGPSAHATKPVAWVAYMVMQYYVRALGLRSESCMEKFRFWLDFFSVYVFVGSLQ